MKKSVLRMIYILAYYLGILKACAVLNRRRPIIITYHNIIDDQLLGESRQMSLTQSASTFEKQLAIISRHYSFSHELEAGKVLVTFDDGYRNNAQVAAPIMARQGVSATFFVPACYFDSAEMLWVDRLLLWLSHVPAGRYVVAGDAITITDGPSREAALATVWRGLLSDYSARDHVVAEMDGAFSFAELDVDNAYFDQRYQPLSPGEIKQLIAQGHRVACHSYCHEILSKLSADELSRDFERCAGHWTSYNSTWFGYPFGRPDEVSQDVVEACRRAGYSKAFLNVNGRGEDPWRLPRINMPEEADKYLICARLSGFEYLLKKLVGAVAA